jgi:hypothetical protein
MNNNGIMNNPWVKLAIVCLVAIVLIFVILWGVNAISYNHMYGNMNMGYGYQMNGMMNQGQMNMQGNMGGMNSGMGMMNGMGMMGNMQGGMGMH